MMEKPESFLLFEILYRTDIRAGEPLALTPEESYRIEPLAKVASVTQQKYIMAKLENKGFTVVLDIRAHKMLRDEMRPVYQELRKLRGRSQMDEPLVSKVELLADLFIGMTAGAPSILEIEDTMIDEMERGWKSENPLLLFLTLRLQHPYFTVFQDHRIGLIECKLEIIKHGKPAVPHVPHTTAIVDGADDLRLAILVVLPRGFHHSVWTDSAKAKRHSVDNLPRKSGLLPVGIICGVSKGNRSALQPLNLLSQCNAHTATSLRVCLQGLLKVGSLSFDSRGGEVAVVLHAHLPYDRLELEGSCGLLLG